jgi:hypothetical protein
VKQKIFIYLFFAFYYMFEVEQRKREKQEEKLARERVKAQIEADKAARRAKSSNTAPPESTPIVVSNTIQSAPVVARDYKEAKIQLRLPSGETLVETFDKNEQLAAVRLFVQIKQNNETGAFSYGMMTTFPRKVFTPDDYEKTLEQLNLVPTATIMVTKNPAC